MPEKNPDIIVYIEDTLPQVAIVPPRIITSNDLNSYHRSSSR